MEDELKKNLIALFVKRGHKGKDIVDEVKEILSLLSPVLADAEKWRVLEKKYPMTINNELLAKFEGKCWHKTTNEYPFRCAICGQSETDWQGWFICPHNPDYSTSPADRERLWGYLMGKEEMWKAFDGWAWVQSGDLRTTEFIPWLFSPLDGVPRWVSLLSEWLRLDETIERFGWEQCTEDNRPSDCMQDRDECRLQVGKMGDSSGKCCLGKIKAEWAR